MIETCRLVGVFKVVDTSKLKQEDRINVAYGLLQHINASFQSRCNTRIELTSLDIESLSEKIKFLEQGIAFTINFRITIGDKQDKKKQDREEIYQCIRGTMHYIKNNLSEYYGVVPVIGKYEII